MPYRKRAYKPRKRRVVRRRRRYGPRKNRPVTSIGRVGNVVPDMMMTKLRYHQHLDLSGVGISSIQFSATNLQDPNVTGIGAQPRGYDQ